MSSRPPLPPYWRSSFDLITTGPRPRRGGSAVRQSSRQYTSGPAAPRGVWRLGGGGGHGPGASSGAARPGGGSWGGRGDGRAGLPPRPSRRVSSLPLAPACRGPDRAAALLAALALRRLALLRHLHEPLEQGPRV